MQRKVEAAVAELPEVELMFSMTGTAEVATDPMPVNVSDGFVILKPEDQWPEGVHTKDEAFARLQEAVSDLLGQVFQVSRPIALRFYALCSVVHGHVVIRLSDDNRARMWRTANER